MSTLDSSHAENAARSASDIAGSGQPLSSAREASARGYNTITNGRLSILLAEDNPADARLGREMLAQAEAFRFDVVCADGLSTALDYLTKGGIDAVLLDLSLPDSQGVATFIKAIVRRRIHRS